MDHIKEKIYIKERYRIDYKLLKPFTEEVWNNLKKNLINLGNEDFIVGSSNYKDHQIILLKLNNLNINIL